VNTLLAAAFAATIAAPLYAQHELPPKPPERLPDHEEPARPGEVGVLPVQGHVYLLNLGDVNIVASVGDDGILLVDSGPPEWSDRLLATLRRRFGTRPIRYIINTHMHPDHTGGNAALMKASGRPGGDFGFGGGNQGAKLIAHENTLNRMSGATDGEKELPQEMLPTSTFFTEKKEIYFNGEPIEILYQPAAHTDGDVMVFFRGSDVIAAGDLFSTASYPILDDKRGATYQGHLDALNRILDITVPRFNEQGGTMVIPGHGRLCNESDVDDYRNWMTIVRDRVQEMIKKGMTLQQVKAAKPTLDYDGVFLNKNWTTDQFVDAVFRDMSRAAAPARRTSN
jgi:glyoxylase-like metal-dependent hydrolase (beta-lactamase superfamily II)